MCSQAPLKELITNSALGPLLDTVQKEPFTLVTCGELKILDWELNSRPLECKLSVTAICP
jgi:hypothetical protein